MITVISTALKSPFKQRCIDSVASQVGVRVEHIYIDSDPSVTKLENLWRVVHSLEPDCIVAEVDGDDWLSRKDALAIIKRAYHDPKIIMTYGSYRHDDGRLGCAAAYQSYEIPRTAPWRASHLKTYRAGLFQQIKKEDLKIDGKWITRATDQATMFPMLEMAGPDRSTFIPDVLYVYNYEASFERLAAYSEIQHERDTSLHIRQKRVYQRVLGRDAWLQGSVSSFG